MGEAELAKHQCCIWHRGWLALIVMLYTALNRKTRMVKTSFKDCTERLGVIIDSN
jgi:hypothetical protein